jgi:hypothetical protein
MGYKGWEGWGMRIIFTFCSSKVEDGEELSLDLSGELNQLTAAVQVLVTGNHLSGGIKAAHK